MSMRNLKPGETPREAMLNDFTDMVEKLKANVPFDDFEKAAMALALATTFSWTEKMNDYKMPLLVKEVDQAADTIMEQWGWKQKEEEAE